MPGGIEVYLELGHADNLPSRDSVGVHDVTATAGRPEGASSDKVVPLRSRSLGPRSDDPRSTPHSLPPARWISLWIAKPTPPVGNKWFSRWTSCGRARKSCRDMRLDERVCAYIGVTHNPSGASPRWMPVHRAGISAFVFTSTPSRVHRNTLRRENGGNRGSATKPIPFGRLWLKVVVGWNLLPAGNLPQLGGLDADFRCSWL